LATRRSIDRFRTQARQNSTILRDVGFPDIDSASKNLEGTYIIRIFTEFETALRLFWITDRSTKPPKDAVRLLSGLAVKVRISNDCLMRVHEVRGYRNNLAHNREEPANVVSFVTARHRLNEFRGRLHGPR